MMRRLAFSIFIVALFFVFELASDKTSKYFVSGYLEDKRELVEAFRTNPGGLNKEQEAAIIESGETIVSIELWIDSFFFLVMLLSAYIVFYKFEPR